MMTRLKYTYFFLALINFPFILLQTASADDKSQILQQIDARFDQHKAIALKLYDYAELGYQEHNSSALLQQTLKNAGFKVQSGVAGIPTSFIASSGSGKPVIALLAEYDALPGISQSAVPYRHKDPNKNAGHACGHHLFGTASTAAAIAIRQWLQANKHKGTVRVYGTPAEEGGSGKVYMVREGLFKDVDAVLNWHPSDENLAKANYSLANRSAKFRFYGVSAHAAGAPHKARSALDGVEAFNYMSNLLREHVPQETRIHYVITQGGHAPNVVPDFAEVFYYVRHPKADTLINIWQRVEKAAKAAALGTGTEVKWEIIHGNHSLLPNVALAELTQRNLEIVGGVHYDKSEQAFAEKLYSSLNQPDAKLGSQAVIQAMRSLETSKGSTDVGDISWNVPTAGLATATWVPGTSSHSWQAIAAGGTTIGIKGLQVAAKTMALTAIDLYRDPKHLKAIQQEFQQRRGHNFQYQPLLGNRKPPLDYRK